MKAGSLQTGDLDAAEGGAIAESDTDNPERAIDSYYPEKSSDWTARILETYRHERELEVSLLECGVEIDVKRRWIVARHDLTKLFPDLPDIGNCTMTGDGDAIPNPRDWPRKYQKKGIPENTLPGYPNVCTRRAVTRWCHVKYASSSSKEGITPHEIVMFVDTCLGHHWAFQVPDKPSLGRGSALEVGNWVAIDFSGY
jgi:hypothetical protein